jgi:hypothetical protein
MNGKHGKLRSIQHAVESLWSEKEMFVLLNRLSSLKEASETRVPFSIRLVILLQYGKLIITLPEEALDAQSLRSSARFDSLDKATQRIISSTLEIQTNVTSEISREIRDGMNALTTTVTQLLSRLESLNRDNNRRTRDIIWEGICKNEEISYQRGQHITAAIGMLDISDDAEQNLRSSVQCGIIRSLGYPALTNVMKISIRHTPVPSSGPFMTLPKNNCHGTICLIG